MRMRCTAALGIFLCFSVCPAGSIWDGLDAGPYGVGFRLLEVSDASRTFGPEGRNRPIRMYVWYPAIAEAKKDTMRFGDYAELAREDFGDFGRKHRSWTERYSDLPFARGLPEEELRRTLDSPVAAAGEAQPAAGSFPLLIFGQGLYYESPITHAILCEYLASHGYVVGSCPLVGTNSRWVRLTLVDLETQVRDLEFVLSRSFSLECADPERVGVVGFDLGGMAGLVMAMRRTNLDAFLSLDSGILFEHGSHLPEIMPDYDIGRFRIPWMHMVSRAHYDGTGGDGSVPSLFDEKKTSENYLLIFEEAQHADFTSYAMMEGKQPVPTYWGLSPGDTGKRHVAICRYARAFLDAYLKEDPESLIFIQKKPEEAVPGVPVELRVKTGEDGPYLNADAWLESIFREGIGPAVRTAKALEEQGIPSEVLEEGVLNQLGYKFLYNWVDPTVAVELFKLNVLFHPESSNVYDSLGEAYLVRGDREGAIVNYRRSLERNPENANARRRLEALGVRSF